ncbi:hypothetical protein BDY21DRAFT_358177 [Lineolata rhizophorae]|uniref:Uncharacterized protein n=1 Tax=Lineolata rhizophorae TaxID=578093 RepID=A0A6A6NM44_9PEZI|nr:hypothetical protein BDY21DRAFT_358177 [Lineolata rhizophorae]
MNAAGDYSAAYCILHTDSEFTGHGMSHLHHALLSSIPKFSTPRSQLPHPKTPHRPSPSAAATTSSA